MASIWKPGVEFNVLGIVAGVEFNVGSYGFEYERTSSGVKFGAAAVFGMSLTLEAEVSQPFDKVKFRKNENFKIPSKNFKQIK